MMMMMTAIIYNDTNLSRVGINVCVVSYVVDFCFERRWRERFGNLAVVPLWRLLRLAVLSLSCQQRRRGWKTVVMFLSTVPFSVQCALTVLYDRFHVQLIKLHRDSVSSIASQHR